MVTEFQDRVYKKISKIPKGKVSTYGEVAKAMGIRSSQAIGQALKCNPYAPKVPCHRVVTSNGLIGGFHGHRTGPFIMKKINLLTAEGVVVDGGKVRDFQSVLHSFS